LKHCENTLEATRYGRKKRKKERKHEGIKE